MSNCRQSDASDLLAAAVALDLDDLRRFLDGLAGMPELEQAGYRILKRQRRGELYPRRNDLIRALSRRGLSAGRIANRPDIGMSRQAVLKVLQRSRKNSVDNNNLSTGTPAPTSEK